MKKLFVSVLAALIMVLPITAYANETKAELPSLQQFASTDKSQLTIPFENAIDVKNKDDETAIKNAITEYFNDVFETYSTLTYNKSFKADLDMSLSELDSGVKSGGISKTIIERQAVEKIRLLDATVNTEIERRKMQTDDLRFTDYKYELKYDAIKRNGDSAYVAVLMNKQMQFSFTDEPSIIGNEGHEIELLKINNKWVVIDDNYGNPIKDYLAEEISESKTLEAAAATYLSKESAEVKLQLAYKAELENDNTDMELEAVASRALKSYNRTNAANYAKSYARSYNPSPWSTYKADCTNFVSIALYKGGIPMDRSGQKWYWDSASVYDGTWGAARYLRPYLIGNNNASSSNGGVYATNESYLVNMQTGDVVSMYVGSTIGHSAIITGCGLNASTGFYGHVICQHSYGASYAGGDSYAYNYPLASISNAKLYNRIRGYH